MFGIKGIETETPEVFMSVTLLIFLLGTHLYFTRNKQSLNDPLHVFMTGFLLISSLAFAWLALAGARMDLQSALIIVGGVGICTFNYRRTHGARSCREAHGKAWREVGERT